MKINFFEGLLILIAIFWLLGYFRRLMPRENLPQPSGTPVEPESKIKKNLYGEDGEFVDYEEIK